MDLAYTMYYFICTPLSRNPPPLATRTELLHRARDPPPNRAGELEYGPWEGRGTAASRAAVAGARGGGEASDPFWPAEGRALVGTSRRVGNGGRGLRDRDARKKKGC